MVLLVRCRQPLENAPRKGLIGLDIPPRSGAYHILRKPRRCTFTGPAVGLQPVPHHLLVIALLAPSHLIGLGRPEPAAVGRQNLVCQNQVSIFIKAELKLGIGDDDTLGEGILSTLGVELNALVPDLLGQVLAQNLDGLLVGDVFVMSLFGLGRRRVDGLRKPLGLLKSSRQLDAADGAILLVALPARAGDIAANDALNGKHLQLLHQHTPFREVVLVEVRRHGRVLDGDHVVGDDVLGEVEPEGRHQVQDHPLARDVAGEDGVEGGDPVRGYHHHLSVVDVVDVPDLALADHFH